MADHSLAANVIVGLIFLVPIVTIVVVKTLKRWHAMEEAARAAEMAERKKWEDDVRQATARTKRVVGRTQK